MSPDITHPVISIAWQQFAVSLGCCFLIAVLIQSSAFKEMVRAFRLSPWRSLIILLVAVSWFTLQGSTKAPDVVGKLFKLLFWSPSSPWSLAEPSAKIQDAESAVAFSSNVLVEASGVITNNDVWTLSFDWHAPQRLPYHERQNVLAWTAAVVPTNINGALYEDHYVSFNAGASTNPAVILIEYARTKDDGTVERYSAETITNSYPNTYVVDLQSGSHTCYWFRCAVPIAYTNCVRDWNGEALFGSPADSGHGFDLLGTLVIDDANDIWVGATTNIMLGGVTHSFANGINVTED